MVTTTHLLCFIVSHVLQCNVDSNTGLHQLPCSTWMQYTEQYMEVLPVRPAVIHHVSCDLMSL